MKKSTSYFCWGVALSCAFAFTAACSSSDDAGGSGGTAGESNGDGDGDGDGDNSVGGQGGSSTCEDCPDDGNPCTEDACNPKTGKCGVPRTGTTCDDGVFCNGDDTCEAGECNGHAGNPCSETSCNEGNNTCECSMKSHCPGEDLSDNEFAEAGDWGTVSKGTTCSYENVCDEECSCGVTVTTYECVSSECKATVTNPIDTSCDSRDTDGTDCENGSNLFCDGAEKCSSGICTAPGDPCQGTAAPYCNDSSNRCFQCEGSGAGSIGCNVAEEQHCCSGTCKAKGETCFVIIQNLVLQNLVQNLILQNSISP